MLVAMPQLIRRVFGHDFCFIGGFSQACILVILRGLGEIGVSLCTFSDMIDLYHYSNVYTAIHFLGNKILHCFQFRFLQLGFLVGWCYPPHIPHRGWTAELVKVHIDRAIRRCRDHEINQEESYQMQDLQILTNLSQPLFITQLIPVPFCVMNYP